VKQEGEGNRALGVYRTAALAKTESVYPAAWRAYRRRIKFHWVAWVSMVATLPFFLVHWVPVLIGVLVTVVFGGFSREPFLCPRCGTDWKLFGGGRAPGWAEQCPRCKLRLDQDPSQQELHEGGTVQLPPFDGPRSSLP
jgi:hypothetical protein